MRSVGCERLSLVEGSEVEISYKNNGFKKVWYKAIIELTKPNSTLRERCVRLLKDDSSTLLTDLITKVTFRPIPPEEHVRAGVDMLKEGSIVDAVHKGGWWTGLLVKQSEDDKCLVLFDSPPDIIQFERKHLRPHLDWRQARLWMLPGPDLQFLRGLHDKKSMFISGTMVEVSDTIDNGEVAWVPSMIVKEIEEEKYIVKACDNPWSCEGIKARPNETVDQRSLRPRPPPFSAKEHQLVDYVEVLHWRHWRQARFIGMMSENWLPGKLCKVRLEATNKEMCFKLSDTRPSKVWEDGVWKPRKSPSTQGSENKMSASAMNAKESGAPVTPSPGITATPLIQPRENGTSEDNIRKRKREGNLSSVAIVEENEANDIATVLPFEKKLPIWTTLESMDVFKKIPQSPHFSPLLEIREDSREVSAVGMMLTFAGLLEEVKNLQPNNPISSLNTLRDSFAELEKHGFDVEVPKLRISKLLSVRDRRTKKMEELKTAEKVTAEKERIKDENERKILELRKLNEEAEKEVAQSKSCEATIVQQLEDEELLFLITASAPW